MNKKLGFAVLAAMIAFPVVANAQGVSRGAREGAEEGADAAGPVGGIVGGVIGGVTGGVAGLLGADDRPRFREYVTHERVPSYRYGREVVVGSELPEEGVTYYNVPREYRVGPGYRYTVVDGRTVLVRGHRVVQVLD